MSSLQCPECRDGKHTNCTAMAWDYEIDGLGPCQCECRACVRGTPGCRFQEQDHEECETW